MIRAVTALGDAALLVPSAFLLAAYLAGSGRRRLALAWLLALAVDGAVTIAVKLLFHTCGPAVTDLDVVSPSGHTSSSTLFYGALAVMIGAGRPSWQRLALYAAAALLVASIAVSRVLISAHTGAEVFIGLAVGLLALVLFILLHRSLGRPAVAVWPVVVGFMGAVILLGGLHLSLERPIGVAARWISERLDVCADTGDAVGSYGRR